MYNEERRGLAGSGGRALLGFLSRAQVGPASRTDMEPRHGVLAHSPSCSRWTSRQGKERMQGGTMEPRAWAGQRVLQASPCLGSSSGNPLNITILPQFGNSLRILASTPSRDPAPGAPFPSTPTNINYPLAAPLRSSSKSPQHSAVEP